MQTTFAKCLHAVNITVTLRPVLLNLFVAADPFHCTQNRCGSLRLVNISIIEKLDLVAS